MVLVKVVSGGEVVPVEVVAIVLVVGARVVTNPKITMAWLNSLTSIKLS